MYIERYFPESLASSEEGISSKQNCSTFKYVTRNIILLPLDIGFFNTHTEISEG